MMSYKPLMTFNESTEFLQCSKGFLRTLINDGLIKPRYVKTRIYFLTTEIHEYIKNCPTKKEQK